MSTWGCPACGSLLAQRLYAGCPRCPDVQLVEENNMPKITAQGGPSNGSAEPEEVEQPSVGTSFSTSQPTLPSPSESNATEDPSPAPTTGSRSPRRRKEPAVSADSTATSGPATGGGR